MKQKRLGRGLRGLIQPAEAASPSVDDRRRRQPVEVPQPPADEPATRELQISEIHPNPYQPRTAFAEQDLDDLQASIAEHGVLQPIVVRRMPGGGGYEVIAGERRLRAVKALGRSRIPALVRSADDEDMQTLALVENLQRVDLNALEKARALKAMMRNFGLTQLQVAERVGKARTSISNLVRLLELPPEVQKLVAENVLSGAQARAVLLVKGTEARIAIARRAAREGLTVRRIEKLATASRTPAKTPEPDPYIKDLEDRLRRALGTRVILRTRGAGGRIEVEYHDAGELDRLLELLGAG